MVTESMFNSFFSCFLFSCLAKSSASSLGQWASTWCDWKPVHTCLTLLGWNMEAIIYLISSMLDGTEIAFLWCTHFLRYGHRTLSGFIKCWWLGVITAQLQCTVTVEEGVTVSKKHCIPSFSSSFVCAGGRLYQRAKHYHAAPKELPLPKWRM